MANQYLDELAAAHGGKGISPQEADTLKRIAALRDAGHSDAEIFGGASGEGGQTVGGGYGYLPYVLQAAGINSSYNLGRGNIALNAQEDYYKRQSNPFEIVGALQQQRDLNTGVGDQTLSNITPSATPYQAYLNSLFASGAGAGAPGTDGAGGGGQQQQNTSGLDAATIARGAQAGLDPATIKRIQDAYARDPQTANLFFSMGNPHVYTGSGGNSVYEPNSGGLTSSVLGTATTPGGESVTPLVPPGSGTVIAPGAVTGQIPQTAAGGGGSAQSAAAQLIGGAVHQGMATGQFRNTLLSGKVPGFGSINEADMAKLTPDQRNAYFGAVGSTGMVSDPAAAYADYAKKYSQGGLGGGGSYR